jgi:predicted dehydrogenase
MARRLRVGLIGANVDYGWSPRAHLPALLALPDLELAAVCTSHADTARESAAKFGAPLAFDNHLEMLEQTDLDIVGVSVRVPLHHRLTMDVLNTGKHVYTEWPLGASLREAEEMAGLAGRKGVRTMTGLQGRCSPYYLRLRELIREGYVGEVLAANMTSFGSGVLSRTSDRTWQSDRAQGATTMTIAFGHIVDTLCMCLGEFAQVSAVVGTRVPQWRETDTDRMVDVTAPDNVLVSGVLKSGAMVSAHVGSVPWHGGGYRLQVYGREGTLVIEAQQHPHLDTMRIMGGKGDDPELKELPIPRRLTWVPDAVPQGPPFNVAQMWSRFANAIMTGEPAEPDFATAVTRHRLLDAMQRASDTGKRQIL